MTLTACIRGVTFGRQVRGTVKMPSLIKCNKFDRQGVGYSKSYVTPFAVKANKRCFVLLCENVTAKIIVLHIK